jgi:hypothetical protein
MPVARKKVRRAPKLTRDEMKAVTKEALREWLDDKYATFGKWSLRAIGAAALGALLYFVLTSQGWHPPVGR